MRVPAHPHSSPGSPGIFHTRYLLPLTVFALLAALFASGVGPQAQAANNDPIRIVVTPANMTSLSNTNAQANWAFTDDQADPPAILDPIGNNTMVAGPTPSPLGTGSAYIFLPTSIDGTLLSTPDYAGTPLSAISNLSYWTYYTNVAPIALDMDVDFDGGPTYEGRLNFVPSFMPGSILPNTWQQWDPMTQRGWYLSKASMLGSSCTLSTPCTWAEVLTEFPNAHIVDNDSFSGNGFLGSVGFKAGSGWTGFSGNVDDFTITANGLTTIYDFEAESPCANNGNTCYVAKTGSDTTGNGTATNPFRTIQAGVNAVNAGGTVIAGAGTYNESVQVYQPLTLQGAGAGQDPGTYTGQPTIISSTGLGPSGNGIDIYTNDVIPTSGVTIDGIRFQYNNAGINLQPTLRNGSSITGSTGSGFTLVNNLFFENAQGVQVNNTVIESLIQGNVFYWDRNTAYPDSGYGVLVKGVLSGSAIDNNVFTGENSSAIEFAESSGDSIMTYISNNISNGNGHFAVLTHYGLVYQSDFPVNYYCDIQDVQNLICDNTVIQTGGDAIVIGDGASYFTIAGNTISRGTGAAIAQISETSYNIDIQSNLLSANAYGLNLQAGTLTGISYNQFVSNRTAGVNISATYNPALIMMFRNFIQSNKAGLVNGSGISFNATCNWWNATSGPRVSTNPGGAGDTVVGLDRGSYQPWLVAKDMWAGCDHQAPAVTVYLDGVAYGVDPSGPVFLDVPASGLVKYMITFTCVDEPGGSGIASCKSTAPYVYIYRGSARSGSFTVTGIDKAGNSASVTIDWIAGSLPG